MLAEGTQLSVYVTSLKSESVWLKLFAQVEWERADAIEEALKGLESELESQENVPHPGDLHVGDICCAKFVDDNKWYRARIVDLALVLTNKVGVKFLDYGNVEMVSLKDVRKVDHPLFSQPPLAVEFVLADVTSPQWDSDAIEALREKLLYEELTGTVVAFDGSVPKLKLEKLPPELEKHVAQYAPSVSDAFAYRVAPLKIGSSFPAVVVNIETPSQFWIQRSEDEALLESIGNELESQASAIERCLLQSCVVGACCVARFADDGRLYRAVVDKVMGNECVISYIDYSNKENKKANELFQLPASLRKYSVLAYECCLHGANLVKMTDELIDKFSDLSTESTAMCSVVSLGSDGRYVVQLENQKTTLAAWWKSLLISSSVVSAAPTPPPSLQQLHYTHLNVERNFAYEVHVVRINFVTEFYCQLHQHMEMLSQLMDTLQKDRTFELMPEAEMQPLTACLSKYEDGMWFRSEIVQKGRDRLLVRFVDYGHVMNVSTNDVARIDAKYVKMLPAQAIRCHLSGLSDVKDGGALFESLCVDKVLVMKVIKVTSDSSIVDLFDMDAVPHVYINKEIRNALESTAVVAKPSSKVISPPSLGKVEKFYVTTVVSHGRFFAQLCKFSSESLDTFSDLLNQYYGGISKDALCLYDDGLSHIGENCCAQFTVDGLFYRGRINTEFEGEAEVFFIDYGNAERKPINTIKMIESQFCDLPQQGILCSFGDEHDVLTTTELSQALHEQELELEVGEVVDGVQKVKFTDNPINDHLKGVLAKYVDIAHEDDFSVLRYFRKPLLLTKEKVIVTHIVNPNNVWCQLQTSANILLEMMEDIMQFCTAHPHMNRLEEPRVGNPCLAEYTDGGWYRAVIKSIALPNVEVLFVDFGNTEIIGLDKIKVIIGRYLSLSRQCICCSLKGVPQKTDWSPEDITKLETLILEKDLMGLFEAHETTRDFYYVTLEDSFHKNLNTEFLNYLTPPEDESSHTIAVQVTRTPPEMDDNVWDEEKSAPAATSGFGSSNRTVSFGSAAGAKPAPNSGASGFGSNTGTSSFTPNSQSSFASNRNMGSFGGGNDDYRDKRMPNSRSTDGGSGFGNRSDTGRPFGRQNSSSSSDDLRSGRPRADYNDRNKSSFGRDRDSTSSFGRDRDSTSSFGRDRETPAFGHDRDSSSFGRDAGNRRDGRNQDARPGFRKNNWSENDSGTRSSGDRNRNSFKSEENWNESGSRSFSDRSRNSNSPSRKSEDNWDNGRKTARPNRHGSFRSEDSNSNRQGGFRSEDSNSFGTGRSVGGGRKDSVTDSEKENWEKELNEPAGLTLKESLKSHDFASDWSGKSDTTWGQASTNHGGKTWDSSKTNTTEQPAQPFLSKSVQKANVGKFTNLCLKINQFKDVTVVHAVSPSEFYCHLVEEAGALEEMMNNIATVYDSPESNSLRLVLPQPEMPCCAKFNEDQMWYRAKVTSANDKIQVLFVDYGNTDVIAVDDVKDLKSEFFAVPLQALRCCLHNVNPVKASWMVDDVTEFQNMTLQKSFVAEVMEIKSDGTFALNLIDVAQGDEMLNQTFVKSGHGKFNVVENVPPAVDEIVDYVCSTLEPGLQEVVSVSWVKNFSEFYCSRLSSRANLDNLMVKIQRFYANPKSRNMIMTSWNVDQPCVAKFSEDGVWYRARIKETSGDLVTVYYVDFGNSEKLPKDKIQAIKSEYMSFPPQAIKCKLFGIKHDNSTWSKIPSQTFEKYLRGKASCKFLCHQDHCYVVQWFVNNKDIAEQIVKDGVGVANGLPAEKYFVDDVAVPKIFDAELNCSQIQRPELDWGVNDYRDVLIRDGGNPDLFWCYLVSNSKQHDELTEKLTKFYGSLTADEKKLVNPKKGTACALNSTVVGAWQRAVVVERLSPMKLTVFLVDALEEEDTTITQVKELASEFLSISRHFFPCRLANMSESCTERLKNTFERFTCGKELVVQLVEENSGLNIVKLFDISDGVEKNLEEMISKELVKEKEKVAPFLINDVVWNHGETKTVRVSHVGTPEKFWCQLSVGNDVANFTAAFDNEVNKKDLESPSIGMACVVRSQDDVAWYRAVIRKIITADKLRIFAVDSGKEEDVKLDRLKQLPQNLLYIPVETVECHLHGYDTLDVAPNVYYRFVNIVADAELEAKLEAIDDGVYNVILQISIADQLVDVLELLNANDNLAVDQNIKPAEIEWDVGEEKRVCVTGLGLPDQFWCQLASMTEEFADFSKTLSTHYEELQVDEDETLVLDVGTYCMAKSMESEKWHRAVIQTKCSATSYLVSHVDTGHWEKITVDKIKPIEPGFLERSALAFRCRLSNLPVDTDIGNLGYFFFDVIYDNHDFIARLDSRENNVFEVTLWYGCDDDRCNINEYIVAKCRGDVLLSPRSRPKRSVVELKPLVVDIGKHCGYILHVNSPQDFYIHLAEREDELHSMGNKLNEHYSSLAQDELKINEPFVGQLCCSLYTQDEMWYRSQIVELNDEEVTVRFVDYGNTDVVSRVNIKELPAEYLAHPTLAVRCMLAGEVSTSLTVTNFYNCTLEKDLNIEFITAEEPCQVIIRDAETDASLSDMLAAFEQAEKSNVEATGQSDDVGPQEYVTPLEEKPQVVQLKEEEEETSLLGVSAKDDDEALSTEKLMDQFSELPLTQDDPNASIRRIRFGHKQKGTVSHIISPGQFWLQMNDDQMALEVLQAKLNPSEETTLEPLASAPQNNTLLVALYPEDGTWYRAKVLAVEENDVHVQFVDYGNSSSVKLDDTRSLPSDLTQIPEMALQCELSNVMTGEDDWTLEAIEEFENIVLEKELLVEFVALNDGRYGVRLLEMGSNVASRLADAGHTELVDFQVSVVPSPSTSSEFEKISHAEMHQVADNLETLCSISSFSDFEASYTDQHKEVSLPTVSASYKSVQQERLEDIVETSVTDEGASKDATEESCQVEPDVDTTTSDFEDSLTVESKSFEYRHGSSSCLPLDDELMVGNVDLSDVDEQPKDVAVDPNVDSVPVPFDEDGDKCKLDEEISKEDKIDESNDMEANVDVNPAIVDGPSEGVTNDIEENVDVIQAIVDEPCEGLTNDIEANVDAIQAIVDGPSEGLTNDDDDKEVVDKPTDDEVVTDDCQDVLDAEVLVTADDGINSEDLISVDEARCAISDNDVAHENVAEEDDVEQIKGAINIDDQLIVEEPVNQQLKDLIADGDIDVISPIEEPVDNQQLKDLIVDEDIDAISPIEEPVDNQQLKELIVDGDIGVISPIEEPSSLSSSNISSPRLDKKDDNVCDDDDAASSALKIKDIEKLASVKAASPFGDVEGSVDATILAPEADKTQQVESKIDIADVVLAVSEIDED